MFAFMRHASRVAGKDLTTYDRLYNWSVTEIPLFWETLWKYFDIIHSKPYERVLEGNYIPETVWFPGARLNFAENLLRYNDDHPAIIATDESGKTVTCTYNELHQKVASVADRLKKMGVRKNDRVTAFITNIPEAVIAMLATTSIGAVWSSCSPDFGFQGVLDRFGQIQPKVLIAVNGYNYNGVDRFASR